MTANFMQDNLQYVVIEEISDTIADYSPISAPRRIIAAFAGPTDARNWIESNWVPEQGKFLLYEFNSLTRRYKMI